MPLKDWSTTAASNNAASPYGAAEGWALSDINNVMRQVMADVRTLAASDTIASASTTDLGTKDSTFLTVSGTTTITGLGTVSAGIYKFVTFSGALILTHNATSLILRDSSNITTAAGDTALFLSLGSGNWKCIFYERISGAPLNANLAAIAALAVTDNNIIVGNGSTWVAESGATARTSLGLGTAATVNTGTGSGNVPLVGTSSATETLAGLVELATTAEAAAGVDTSRAVTSAGVASAISALATDKIKAWINFDGTSASIGSGRANFNVASVTDNGTGDYTINFTSAISDANYVIIGSSSDNNGSSTPTTVWISHATPPTTTAARIGVRGLNNTSYDSAYIHVAFIR